MNFNNNQTETNNAQCCVDYCKTTFKVADQKVVNSYKCGQGLFTVSDMWRILKNRKKTMTRSSIV